MVKAKQTKTFECNECGSEPCVVIIPDYEQPPEYCPVDGINDSDWIDVSYCPVCGELD